MRKPRVKDYILPLPSVCRNLRISTGLSVAELAKVLECSPASLYRWENAAVQPRGEFRRRYSAIINELRKELDEREV